MARLTITGDGDGNIIELDGEVEAILGWSPSELLGKSIAEIIPYKYRKRHAAGWERWCTTQQKRAMGSWIEVEARRADGNVIPVTFCVTERKGVVQAVLELRSDHCPEE